MKRMEWYDWSERHSVKITRKTQDMGEFKFSLSQVVCDKVTGFKGSITARAQYQLGTNRYQVTSFKKGRVIEEWFDEPRIARAVSG